MMAKKDLNAAAQQATAGFFSAKPAEKAKSTKQESTQTTPQAEDKPVQKQKAVRKSFSFRGDSEDVLRWQNYGMAIKNTHAPTEKFRVDEIWCRAIEEYIERNPLKGKAKEIYNDYMSKSSTI